MVTHLNIGSNLGDRLTTLEQAVALIEHHTGQRCRLSPVVESEPWGYRSPNPFLNIGVTLDWQGTPEELLDITQRVERLMGSAQHRDLDGNYIDRLVDIDIIFISNLRLNTPRLTIPHPRAHQRPFVLTPLHHLHPDIEGFKAE